MSGELLYHQPYGTFLRATTPRHSFHHDLESILWVLLWICLYQCGPGAHRPALTDRHDKLHKYLVEHARQLFEEPDLDQLACNKEMVILYSMRFERYISLVDDFYVPLTPLLRKLWTILNTGYTTGHFDFDSTMDQFATAFDEAEQDLKQSPLILTPAQEANVHAEEGRRAKDHDDWEHTPCPVADNGAKPAGAILGPQQVQQQIPCANSVGRKAAGRKNMKCTRKPTNTSVPTMASQHARERGGGAMGSNRSGASTKKRK